MSHPIENIMQSSMEHIKALADVNTVIGDPLMTDDDTMILPVSKVSLGMLVGGGEYLSLSPLKKSAVEINADANYPFIGASAVGMSLTPLAFLAVQSGSVRVLPAKHDCTVDRLVDLVPQVLDAAERLIKELACGSKDNGNSSKPAGASSAVYRTGSGSQPRYSGYHKGYAEQTEHDDGMRE